MEYYCSEKFRMNSNSTKTDIWLIYKCSKCDTTLKLTIGKGIKPHDISSKLFDQFTNNDVKLAWDYAFDRNFLKKNNCVVQYTGVLYNIEGHIPQKWDKPVTIHLESQYTFDLKLSTMLANALNISVSKLKTLVNNGLITTNPQCDIMKHRIKSDIEIFIKPLDNLLT